MGVAPYFEKSALSAASLFGSFDYQRFLGLIATKTPVIAFDDAAATAKESSLTLELLVDLCSRLYPHLSVVVLGDKTAAASKLATALARRAEKINPNIQVAEAIPEHSDVAAVVVGRTILSHAIDCVYVGSNGWVVEYSATTPVRCGQTSLPFAAGAAACFGAAVVFRSLFQEELSRSGDLNDSVQRRVRDPDPVRLSLISFAQVAGTDPQDVYDFAEVGTSILVGLGAVGNGAVWALSRAPGIVGSITLLDHESIELNNLQRYVLADMTSVGATKVDVAANYFAAQSPSPRLQTVALQKTWEEFAASSSNGRFDRVLVALDSAEARLDVQASLPRWIVNAWTQPENLGVSRHPDFSKNACLACLYIPSGPAKSRDVLIAEALRAEGSDELMEIRTRLYDSRPVGEPFVRRVATRLGIPFEPLQSFADQPLSELYVRGVCGGLILSLGGDPSSARVEVPMPFQSALAGILLAAELVIDAIKARTEGLPCRTEINLMRPLGDHLNIPATKLSSGRCICQDKVFVSAYEQKWFASDLPLDPSW